MKQALPRRTVPFVALAPFDPFPLPPLYFSSASTGWVRIAVLFSILSTKDDHVEIEDTCDVDDGEKGACPLICLRWSWSWSWSVRIEEGWWRIE
ncbi:hypothetical protein VNO78_28513 [Psophocarpus tetragonolobus]|uniref:Uncharacterized protein n=1 Tax=Psophocarpus tetragonolobus TaxID=3891 RepID=A0AAN9XBS5_PSOTE